MNLRRKRTEGDGVVAGVDAGVVGGVAGMAGDVVGAGAAGVEAGVAGGAGDGVGIAVGDGAAGVEDGLIMLVYRGPISATDTGPATTTRMAAIAGSMPMQKG